MRWDSLSRTPLQRPYVPRVARLFSKFLGSSEPGIPFWPGCHTFHGSGMREYKPHPLFRTCASEFGGTHSHACHSGAPDFPELRVNTRSPLGLVYLGFHFGCVLMRFLEVACVTKRLTPYFAPVPHSAQPVALRRATPAPLISRSCTSIPEVPWV